MIQLTTQHKLFVYTEAIDFRKGIDGLVGICRSKLKENPFSGTVFAFRNSKYTAVKLLIYDGSGFWLMHKRFSQGKLKYWPTDSQQSICAIKMMVLLNQGQLLSLPKPWRELPTSSSDKVD